MKNLIPDLKSELAIEKNLTLIPTWSTQIFPITIEWVPQVWIPLLCLTPIIYMTVTSHQYVTSKSTFDKKKYLSLHVI